MFHLVDVVPGLEVAITGVAVEVLLDLVLAKMVLVVKGVAAVVTLVLWPIGFRGFGPMVHVIHVLVDRVPTPEVPVARLAFKVGRAVAGGVHVLLTRPPASGKCAPTGSAGGHVALRTGA